MRLSVPSGHTIHMPHVALRKDTRKDMGMDIRKDRSRAAVVAADMTETVRWAWGFIAMTLPVAIVAVLLVDSAAAAFDFSATGVWAGAVVYAAVVAPLVASIATGVHGWRWGHDTLALRAALLSAGLLLVGSTLVLGAWLG